MPVPSDVSRGVLSTLEGLFSHSLEGVCPDQAAPLRIFTKGLNDIVELIMLRRLAKLAEAGPGRVDTGFVHS